MCHTHRLFLFHEEFCRCDFLKFIFIVHVIICFKLLISSGCSSTFNFSSLFTSIVFYNSLSYYGLFIFMFFLNVSLLFISFFMNWMNCLIGNFQPHLLRSYHKGLIYMPNTCDCQPISISEGFATIISPEFSVLFLDMFFKPIFLCTCLITRQINSIYFSVGV